MKILILFLFIHPYLFILNCFAQQPGWEIIPSGTATELNSIYFYDYEVGFACGDSGIVIKTIDSGKTWQALQSPTTNHLNDIYMFHRDTILVVGNLGTILFSTNAGSTWMSDSGNISDELFSIHFSNGNGVAGGSYQSIYWVVYTGSSLTWTEIQSGFLAGGFYGAYMISPQIGFVAGENSIFQPLFARTTDSGFTWDFTAFYLNSNEGRATGVDFTDLNTGFISARVWAGTGAIAKTTDGGNNWTTAIFSNPLRSIDFPISSASLVGYAVGDAGTILKTFNAGDNWAQQNSGITSRLNKVFFIDLDFGFAVGENGTIIRTTSGGGPINFVENENQPPHSFELFQNYPNPFNPGTSIQYAIGSRQFVSLKVYDVLGNEIATIVNEEKSPGTYEVEFNTSSIKHHPSSGIYFYQLKADSFVQTKKMLLLK